MDTEDRWYVRFRGHTLGPLTSEQVKSSVRRKELGPDDKLASVSDPNWRALRTESDFLRCWESLTRPMPAELAPLPSPKILWQKKRAPLPVAVAPSAAERPAAPSAAERPAAPSAAERPVAPSAAVQPAPAPAAKAKPKAKPKAKAAKKKVSAKRPAKTKAENKTVQEPKAPVPLMAIPEKPQSVEIALPANEPLPAPAAAQPVIAPSVVEPIAVAPSAAVQPAAPPVAISTEQTAPSPKLAEETLSLLEALRDWNRKEKENRPAPEVAAASNPAISSVAQESSGRIPAFARPEMPQSAPLPAPAEKRGIELKLNLVISKQFIFISALVAALAIAAVIYTAIEAKKMRGPVDSRLPDPSCPTIEPSPKDDPIPQLKAPTRPRRD